jgi:D-amino-acid dehydrogenase
MEVVHPLYLAEAKVGLTPFNSMLRIAGTMELSGINLTLDRQRIAAIRQAVGRYVVGWEKGDGEMEWSGMRPLTPDGLPVLGRAPHSDNLYVATGHAMLGVTMAPVTGVVMADLIVSGQPDIDIRPFDPRRFNSRWWPRARTPA